jgi:alpha-beta hydrolase superfamily lysophospholipase
LTCRVTGTARNRKNLAIPSANSRVVAELITHLQLNDYFLYGHSMGGSIAIEAATQLDGLRGLIVSEPNFRPDGDF